MIFSQTIISIVEYTSIKKKARYEMRKVELRMNEQQKYEVIKKLVETNGNIKRAALTIGCTTRTIYNLINGYKEHGKEFFVHGNRGRKPAHAIEDEERQRLVKLYKEEYYDQSYLHYSESLLKDGEAKVSAGTVRNILMSEYILSPMATRSTKKRVKKELAEKKKTTKGKKKQAAIQEKIVDIEESHARRPRCKNFGELIQMDASIHNWFGDSTSALHLAIDDSGSYIVGAYFDDEETLYGYYQITKQILINYGIPYGFLTDRRTVFEYQSKKKKRIEDDTFTQYGYACHRLGIDLRTSSVAQAKGRVERAFGTLQGRLPSELRRAGVQTNEQANAFLNSYIKEYNAKFALDIDNIPSVFEKQPSEREIDLILSVLTERVVDSGHSVKFKNKYYRTVNEDGVAVHYRKGTKGLVVKTLNDDIYFTIDESIYALEEIPEHEIKSRNFGISKPKKEKQKKYIPPMDHPWRSQTFWNYANKQKHRRKYAS